MTKKRCDLSVEEYEKKKKTGTSYFCSKCNRFADKKKKLCKAKKKEKC